MVAGRVADRRRAAGVVAGRGAWCRRSRTAARRGESVAVVARDAGDESVDPEPAEVVAGLVHGVGRAAEQPGHQGAQALVGDAGDGGQGGAQGAGQGLDPRVAEPQGRGPPAILGEGGPCDPLKGWTRQDAALTDTFSIEQAVLIARARACSSSRWASRRGQPTGRRGR